MFYLALARMSFRRHMDSHFYGRLRPDLAPPPDQRHFPDPRDVAATPRLIARHGGTDDPDGEHPDRGEQADGMALGGGGGGVRAHGAGWKNGWKRRSGALGANDHAGGVEAEGNEGREEDGSVQPEHPAEQPAAVGHQAEAV